MSARELRGWASEGKARGKAARGEAPRGSHAVLELRPDRDPIALLELQAASRLSELVPIRYVAEACGWTLARAHARSGDRIAIAEYLGSSKAFDEAVAEFAAAYADLNEEDHKALVRAVRSGRLTAEGRL